MKDYSPKNARRDLDWLARVRCIRHWEQLDGDPAWFVVTTLDAREHELDLAEVRAFWIGAMNGWRAARTSTLSEEVPA